MQKQIKNIARWIELGLKMVAKLLIRCYQLFLSPDKSIFFRWRLAGRVCRHYPHCSQYGYECFDHYSFFTACFRTMDRISRCTPSLQQSYDPVQYRVVFASGSPIGVPFLTALYTDPRYKVVGVMTMPDVSSGRGMKIQENIIVQHSHELGISNELIKKSHSLRLDSKKYANEAQETYKRLQSLDIDILYVVAYGHILPQHILDIPRIAPINIHGSLLPSYRGASPLQSVFLDGLQETGISMMKMEAGLDSGPVVDTQLIPLGFSDTVSDLIQYIKKHTPTRSLDSLDLYCHGEKEEYVQDESLVTYCGKIEKKDGLVFVGYMIDRGGDSLQDIYCKYRAYYLWPKIFFKYRDKIVIIELLVIDELVFDTYKKEGMFVDGVLNPAIQELRVKLEGKKTISWQEFERTRL